MTLRLRQVCLAAPRLEPAVRAVQAIFGLPVCHRDPAVAAYGLENALFVFGHQFVEIVAPSRAGTAAQRFIERSGGRGGYIAIFDTDDAERRRAHVQALGARVVQAFDHAGFSGFQLHPRDCRAAMLEFDRTTGNERIDGAYAPAGAQWLQAQRLERVAGLPWVEVCSPQPPDLAAHWARLIERPLQHATDGTPLLAFELGGLRFVPGDTERLDALHVAVGDPAAVLASARAQGCRCDERGFELCGVCFVPHAPATLRPPSAPSPAPP